MTLDKNRFWVLIMLVTHMLHFGLVGFVYITGDTPLLLLPIFSTVIGFVGAGFIFYVWFSGQIKVED